MSSIKVGNSNGIDITFNKKTQTVLLGGWFDNICGIEEHTLSLKDFLAKLGITLQEVKNAKRLSNVNVKKSVKPITDN